MDLFKNWSTKSETEVKTTLVAQFLQQPEHSWILNDAKFRMRLGDFFSTFPKDHLRQLIHHKKILLLYCYPRMSCSFYQYKNREIVLIFPDLYKLFLSAHFELAYSILAHEIGHVMYEHSQKKISALDAQLEADTYTWEQGYGMQLFSVLADENPTEELVKRLENLKYLINK